MQGSVDSQPNTRLMAASNGALVIQQRRVVALKEVSALAGSMHTMAVYAIDQGHVTMENMEAMADLLGLLKRQVDSLRLDLSSH